MFAQIAAEPEAGELAEIEPEHPVQQRHHDAECEQERSDLFQVLEPPSRDRSHFEQEQRENALERRDEKRFDLFHPALAAQRADDERADELLRQESEIAEREAAFAVREQEVAARMAEVNRTLPPKP